MQPQTHIPTHAGLWSTALEILFVGGGGLFLKGTILKQRLCVFLGYFKAQHVATSMCILELGHLLRVNVRRNPNPKPYALNP